jgi:uncharacterized protein YbjT (DUF2867 family)
VKILVTGSTGFIGRALIPALISEGHDVRAGTRDPGRYEGPGVPVHAEVEDQEAIETALAGCDAAYFLVHGMSDRKDFQKRERRAAAAFAAAASRHDVRVVYLGGLGKGQPTLKHSNHLRSRHEVGEILRGQCETVELQAGIVIGRGSAAFEMMRSMVTWLPVMALPAWVRTRTQPVALQDVIRYLVGALELPAGTYQVGGPEILTYEEMILRYAELTDRRRTMIKVPVPLPALTAQTAKLVTGLVLRLPQPSSPLPLALRLAESLPVEVLVTDDQIVRLLPGPLTGFDHAVRLAEIGRAS